MRTPKHPSRRGGQARPPADSQDPPAPGEIEPGTEAIALRKRHRGLGHEFTDDTERYVQMVERYLGTLPGVEERKA